MGQVKPRSLEDRLRDDWQELPADARRTAEVITYAIKDMLADNGPQWAAALAYYAMLAAFPLLLVIASLASFFIEPQWAVDRLTSMLGDFVPQEGQLRDIVNGVVNARGQVGVLAFAGLIVTGTRVFNTLTLALNIAFDADDSYGFWKRFLMQVVLLLTIGVFFILALLSGFVTRLLWDAARVLPAGDSTAYEAITLLVQAAMMAFAFFLIYYFVPRARPNWRAAAAGAATATALFLIVTPLFQYYVSRFGNYNLIYGSLAIAIILLIWVWIVSLITIFGGEVAAHTQALVIEGRSPEEMQRRHAERSPATKSRG
jgi:YihY family inner membrane protein